MQNPRGDITSLLADWQGGDAAALEALTPLIYEELRSMASSYMRRERAGHTLEPTAVVHEAYLRLSRQGGTAWENRSHFYGIASKLMRQVLVDHARKHLTGKRGTGAKPVALTEAIAFAPSGAADFIDMNSALDRLAQLDERKARAVELHYFGGLNMEETAALLKVSAVTIQRDLKFAEAWLLGELGGSPAGAAKA